MQTPRHPFSWKARLKSFTYAWDGLRQAFRTEHNTWIHLGFTVAAGVLALLFRVDRLECIALIIVMAFVWMAELFNTALEKTMDFISTEKHPQIKLVKDLAAAAVLVASIAAVLVGALIFLPKMF
jgi:diacylglycerol kinase